MERLLSADLKTEKRVAAVCRHSHEAAQSRGREITDSVLAVTNGGKISSTHAEPPAKVFESFVLLYSEPRGARRHDCVSGVEQEFLRPATRRDSLQFEDIEHQMWGKDGFEDAEKKISSIAADLG